MVLFVYLFTTIYADGRFYLWGLFLVRWIIYPNLVLGVPITLGLIQLDRSIFMDLLCGFYLFIIFDLSPYEVDIAPGLLPDMDSPQVDFETHPSTSHQITISILSSHHSGIPHCVSKSVYTIDQPPKMGIKGSQSTSGRGSNPFDPWLTEPQSKKTTTTTNTGI